MGLHNKISCWSSRKKLGRKYKPLRRKASECLSLPFHNLNFLLAQAVQLIHELIDLPVRGRDLAFERGVLVLQFGRGKLPVQRERAKMALH